MYEMSIYVFCIHMFIIHNFDVINISYNMSQLKYHWWPPLPTGPFARLSPILAEMSFFLMHLMTGVLQPSLD